MFGCLYFFCVFFFCCYNKRTIFKNKKTKKEKATLVLCLYRDVNFGKEHSVIKELSDALSKGRKVFTVDLVEASFFQFSFSKSKMKEENPNLILFSYPHTTAASVLQSTGKCVSVVYW